MTCRSAKNRQSCSKVNCSTSQQRSDPMPNRAERRAHAKNNRRGVPQQYDQTHGRARSGMLDEYQLQEKSRRLQDGTDGPWKPTGGTIEETESLLTTSPNYTNPKMFTAFRTPMVPRDQLAAHRTVRNRIPGDHVAAVTSHVVGRHGLHRLRCRRAQPVLHGG